MALLCAFYMVILLLNIAHTPQEKHPILGPCVGIAFTAFSAVLVYEKNTFRFDCRTRIVTWLKQSLFWKSAGEIEFDSISHITLEGLPANRRRSTRRIVIHTENGKIPMTRACYGYGLDRMQEIADRLTELLSASGVETESEEPNGE